VLFCFVCLPDRVLRGNLVTSVQCQQPGEPAPICVYLLPGGIRLVAAAGSSELQCACDVIMHTPCAAPRDGVRQPCIVAHQRMVARSCLLLTHLQLFQTRQTQQPLPSDQHDAGKCAALPWLSINSLFRQC
jgi:hypothetical protein